MTNLSIGIISILAICLLIYSGMHITIALTLCSFIGVWCIRDNFFIASRLLGLAAIDSIQTYDLAVIPLFVLMGLLIDISDVSTDSFRAANYLLRRVHGGVGVATVLGNALVSAVTGVTIAAVAIFTKLAVPQMLKLGYKPRFAVGLVAGSGVLGMMIPPGLLIIVYCLLTEVSVAKMFLATIIPGIFLTFALCTAVILMCWKWPSFAGHPKKATDSDRLSLKEIHSALTPLFLLIAIIFGGIYSGFFTATEAGAVGALGAFLVALNKKKINPQNIKKILLETGSSSSAICILIISANMYARMIALSGMPESFGVWLASAKLGYYGLIVAYVLLLLFLGTFLDSISTVLLSVPLLLPVFVEHNMNLLWIGVITILATEMGIVTPPLGISAFVVKSALDDKRITLEDIYQGSYPFLGIMLAVLIALIIFPSISLFLTH